MDDDFFDFMLFWELMGENEEGFECPLCGATIEKGRELEVVREKGKIFLCPECDGRLVFDSIENEVKACPKEKVKGLQSESKEEEPKMDPKILQAIKRKRQVKLVFVCPKCHKQTTCYDVDIQKARCTNCDWVNQIEHPMPLEEYFKAYYTCIDPSEFGENGIKVKKCPKCERAYDDSWVICFYCNETLVDPSELEKKRDKMKKCPNCEEAYDDSLGICINCNEPPRQTIAKKRQENKKKGESMSRNQIQTGQAEAHWNVSGTRILKYTLEMCHEGLHEHKLISAPEIDMLSNKAELQEQKWIEKWETIETKRRGNAKKESNLEEANSRTEEAIKSLRQIDNLLLHTLSVDDKVDWESLKKKEKYQEKVPAKPIPKKQTKYPPKPDKQSAEFTPVFNLLEIIVKSRRERKIQEFEKKHSTAISGWEKQKLIIDQFNEQLNKDFEDEIKKWENNVGEWEKRKNNFLQEQARFNEKIDRMKEEYLGKNNDSIVEYCEMVLNNSEYPDSFPNNFETEYNPDNRILILEYELPARECFPRVKEVKYIAARKELKESHIAESQINIMFDESMYKIALRTIHELFEADVANALAAISFNGWVKAINRATGKEDNNCILSIQVQKNEFIEIDLSNVDPKTCFKNLKGVASSKLSSLTPIQPILQISRADKRFVEGYAVADKIDSRTNLAAMDWEDFEHLIRELFEKEFKENGGEVKVTQASRDGGVDAIVFDPDPIRGGKIVIQAKRYTNTVGVSAVRDLYGTVLNEGATKGILVSTADYGPDAYAFAKGKPLTLLNGSNLLHLLEKHGHHAKIDLREARKILLEREKQ